jgi:hypothetical protein
MEVHVAISDVMELLNGLKRDEWKSDNAPWFDALDKRQREQTAATVLAALVERKALDSVLDLPRAVKWAVEATDMLRAELARKP